MSLLEGKRILVTGPAGQIAYPLASRLAERNEVFGIARFSDESTRRRCEEAGIRTAAVDLAAPEWSELPDGFDYVLHLAAAILPGDDYDAAIRVNADGTGLLMSRFRDATACLVMSTCGVYAAPRDYTRPVVESDPLGGTPQPYAPTYCISKIAQESVAKFAAREFDLPTTIARMNVAYGDNGGYPAMLVDMLLGGMTVQVMPEGQGDVCSPIHEDDIFAQTPLLLAAAAAPATVVNWGGDEGASIRDIVLALAQRIGVEPCIEAGPAGIHQYWLDPDRRRELAGACRVPLDEGLERMLRARHPEIELR